MYAAPDMGPYGFDYDIYDNIELATRPALQGGNRTYEYNGATRRLDRIRNDSFQTLVGYDYDANGNAKLRDATGIGNLSADGFKYDQASRLTHVHNPLDESQIKARYAYDGHARRVSIVEDGELRVQIYDQGGQYLYEEPDLISDASFSVGQSKEGKPSTRYQYLGNMLVAKSSGNQTTYLHTDHLGSPIAESTAAPVQIEHLPPHEPYGAPGNGTYLDGPGYTGHVVDGLTGLSYMQARYYDPVAGRFLGIDPVGATALGGANFNRYWYANNNPYRFVDPDGNAACPTGSTGCYESPSTERGNAQQPGLSDETKSTFKQIARAQRTGKLSDRTRLNLSGGNEVGFTASPDGTKHNPIKDQQCQTCSDGSTRNRGGMDVSNLGPEEVAGHSHPQGFGQLPGPEDGVMARVTGKPAGVISDRGAFAVEKTDVGYRVWHISGAPLEPAEVKAMISIIDAYNTYQGGSGVSCTSGC